MNLKTENGMGIKPKGIAWKPNYGMGLNKSDGMGLKKSNGMGLSQDKNYFKFNEYERKRKYFQMGSGKPSEPKPRPEPKKKEPPKSKPEPKPKAAPVEQPKPTTEFSPRKKWGAAVATVAAANAFDKGKKAEKYTKEPSPVIPKSEPEPSTVVTV